jgi:hypothetical protein
VNRLFAEIYRPLLYREIRLTLGESLEHESFAAYKMVRTLTESEKCADLVRQITVSVMSPGKRDMLVFGYILSHLKYLEGIRLDSGRPWNEGQTQKMMNIVIKHQSGLKFLELSNARIDFDTLVRVFAGLPSLESYTGAFPGPPFPNEAIQGLLSTISTRFQKIALSPPIDSFSFSQLLRSSQYSLIDLHLTISHRLDVLMIDLSQFANLSTLRIRLDDDLWQSPFFSRSVLRSTHDSDSRRQQKAVAHRLLRQILLSTAKISLKTLWISTESPIIDCPVTMFDALPSSLVHLVTVPDYLGGRIETEEVNFRSRVQAVRKGSLPNLRRISITPYIVKKLTRREDDLQRDEIGRAAEKILSRELKGISIEVLDADMLMLTDPSAQDKLSSSPEVTSSEESEEEDSDEESDEEEEDDEEEETEEEESEYESGGHYY